MRIDSHQHFWHYDPAEYPWMKPDWPIRRDCLPLDLKPLLDAAGLDGSIAVQARQSLEESRFLLELAEHHPIVKGVVGWVDLRSDRVEEQLAKWSQHPKFVGVRHVVQDELDDDFMLGAAFQRGIGLLKQFDLTYDILVYPKQLPAAVRLVERFPEQPFVLDHIAKPLIRDGIHSPWRERFLAIAKHPNVFCKLSGMITEADWKTWKPSDLKPYVEVAREAFGPGRLMYGSDWPVCELAGSYSQVWNSLQEVLGPLSQEVSQAIFGGTARQFYRLPDD